MEREVLKETVITHCKNLSLSSGGREISLIIPLSEEDKERLKSNSGNAEKEYRYADSSTALGINYFSIYKDLHKECEIIYEWKEESPLIVGGVSNLDIEVKEGNIVKFYESKFLEPYYMSNSHFTESYYKANKYKLLGDFGKNIIEKIKEIEAADIRYYNISQLIRHLIAIFNHIYFNPDKYSQINEVQLISICWEMPNRFIEDLKTTVTKKSISYLSKRIDRLAEEKKVTEKYIDGMIKEILQPELKNKTDIKLSFRTDTYNDAIKYLEGSSHLNAFKERYFL